MDLPNDVDSRARTSASRRPSRRSTTQLPHVAQGPIDRERFWSELFPAQVPVVLRGALARHPLVELARGGPVAFLDALVRRAGHNAVTVTSAPPRSGGRMGFGAGRWVDWANREATFASFAADVAEELREPTGHTYYVQSATVRECLPELSPLGELPIVDPTRMLDERRQLWIGSGGQRIPIHRDESHSFAVMLAGAKEFLLFPPEQLPNLHTTARRELAGDPLRSACDPRHPDLATYPRMATALASMVTLRIEPGDVLFLPAQWWHAVDSFGFNAMLNTRWFDVPLAQRGDLTACFAHAMLTARTVAPAQAERLRSQLHATLFEDDGAHARRDDTRAALHVELRAALAVSRAGAAASAPRLDAPLRCNPSLELELHGGDVLLRQGHVRHHLPWAWLPLLRAFTIPSTPTQVLARLGEHYDFERDEALCRIEALLADGVLLGDPGPRAPEGDAAQRARVDATVAHLALSLASLPPHHLHAFEDMVETFAFLRHGAPYPHLPPHEQGLLGAPLGPVARAVFHERTRRNLVERFADDHAGDGFWSRPLRLASGHALRIGVDGLRGDDEAAGTRHHVGWGQLEVLSHFRDACTPTAALARLRESMRIEADELRALVVSMLAAGVLLPTRFVPARADR